MCGIVGLVGSQSSECIQLMNEVQHHRGPDQGGIYRSQEHQLSLAMRRLSIIDLDEGMQPMVDYLQERVVVFNGEIYNAPELRESLIKDGYLFKTTSSDTEVLLHLYDKYREKMVSLLNGMFSFVIYDIKRGELFGARDRMGIKPFFYYLSDKFFAFSSELKSILTLKNVPKEIDLDSLHHYLSLQFIPSPKTIYKGINKLPPGTFFKYDIASSSIAFEKYWLPDFSEKNIVYPSMYKDIKADVRNLLNESVEFWSRSDVPVGCSLSGGIDSTLVASLYSRKYGDLKTWSLGFSDDYAADMDERSIARKVAKKIGSQHTEVVIDSNNIIEDLDRMIWHLDEPYAGGLPSWYVYKAMGGNVKVALTGSGGDEVFGNYGKWKSHSFGLPAFKRAIARSKTMGLNNVIKYPHGSLYHQYFGENEKKKILKAVSNSNTAELIEDLWLGCRSNDPKKVVPFIDFQMQLPEEFMMVADRFSMAWSVESRTPLLDHRLVEYCLGLSSSSVDYKINNKQLLIDSAEDLIPDFVLGQRKKGFVLPISNWIKDELRPLVDHLLGRSYLEKQGLFNNNLYEMFVVPHLSGKKGFSERIWTLLMFQLWYDKNFNFD